MKLEKYISLVLKLIIQCNNSNKIYEASSKTSDCSRVLTQPSNIYMMFVHPDDDCDSKRVPCPISQGYRSALQDSLCFKLYKYGRNWTDCQAQCQSDGGRLIILNSKEKFNFIKHYVQHTTPYLGLKVVKNTLMWTDGSTKMYGPINTINGKCGHIHNGKLGGYYCSWKRQALCEIQMHP